jgi:hypothetical protein
MPHKYNADRRHHIPRLRRRVTNWAEYKEVLRQKSGLTVWLTDEAIFAWKAVPRTTPGDQLRYSDLVITTALISDVACSVPPAAAPDRGGRLVQSSSCSPGFVLAVFVTPASVQDIKAAEMVLDRTVEKHPFTSPS